MKSAFDEDEEGSGQQPANAAKAPAARVSAFDDDAGLRPAARAPAPVPVPLLSDEAHQRIQAAKEKATTVAKEGATQAVNATRRTVPRVQRDLAPGLNRHLRAVFARGISKRVWMTSLVVALVTVCACIAMGWSARRQAEPAPVAVVAPPSVAVVPHAPVTAPTVAPPAAKPAASVVLVDVTSVPVDEPAAHLPVAPAPIVKASAPVAQRRLAPVSFNPLNPAYRSAAPAVQSSIGISKPSTRKGEPTPVKKSPEKTEWEREQAQKLDAFFKKS